MAQLILMVLACIYDREQRKRGNWSEEAFMAEEKGFVDKPESIFGQLLFAVLADDNVDSGVFSRNAIHFMMHMAISYKHDAFAADVKFLMKHHNTLSQKRKYPASLSRVPMVGEIHDRAGEAFQYFFDDNSYTMQWFTVFSSIHPLSGCLRKSFRMLAKVRTLVLTSRLFATLAIAALFYNAAGDAPGVDAPAECQPPVDFWRNLIRDILIGIISALLGKLPLILVTILHRRKFRIPGEGEWSARAIKKHVACVQRKDVVLVMFALLYSLFCMFFSISFISNITMKAQQPYITSFCSYLLQSFAIFPAVIALVYVILANLILRHDPRAIDECRRHFDLHFQEWSKKKEAPALIDELATSKIEWHVHHDRWGTSNRFNID